MTDNNSITQSTTVQLSNGRFVSPELLNRIRECVLDNFIYIQPHTTYTAKKMCGSSFWDYLTPGEQKFAGSCVVHLVKKEGLPLDVVQTKHEYPLTYQLSDSGQKTTR